MPITERAFSPETEDAIARARAFLATLAEPLRTVLDVACMSVLEDVSYTRKDGQYLRWDDRCGRALRGSMDKGPIALRLDDGAPRPPGPSHEQVAERLVRQANEGLRLLREEELPRRAREFFFAAINQGSSTGPSATSRKPRASPAAKPSL